MKKNNFKFTIKIIFLFISFNFLFCSHVYSQQILLKDFSRILFDIRNSRGGNGDTASSLLTFMDLATRYNINDVDITFLVDDESNRRLNSMLGEDHKFRKQMTIAYEGDLSSSKPFDLYISMASPSGLLTHKTLDGIPFTENAIFVIHTVLGNTENESSMNAKSLIKVRNSYFDLPSPGLSEFELGVYGDPVAQMLKGKSEEFTKNFLLSEINKLTDSNLSNQLISLLTKQTFSNSKISLAYGITSKDTKIQFESYLQGILKSANDPICIITPSKFDLHSIQNENIRARIKVLDSNSPLPQAGDKNTVYILKVKNLPHSVFVGLTYYSMKQGVVPIGAGDGFLSAAIQLGEPFSLTKVAWNNSNIENLKKLLLKQLSLLSLKMYHHSDPHKLVEDVFEKIDLSRSFELNNLREAFHNLSRIVPNLTNSLVNMVIGLRRLDANSSLNNKNALMSLGLTPVLPEEIKRRIQIYLNKSSKEALLDVVLGSEMYSPEAKQILQKFYSQTQNSITNAKGKICSSLFIN